MKPILLVLRTSLSRFFISLFYTKKGARRIARMIFLLGLMSVMTTKVSAGSLTRKELIDNDHAQSISVQVIKTNVSACGNNADGSITINPAGGTAPYSFSWTGPGNFTSSDQNITGLPVGFYDVIVTDADFNTATVTGIHISYAYSPVITYSGNNSAGCVNSGVIILYGTAGIAPYTFSLDGTNYQPGNIFTGLAAGNYTAYLKDDKGCTSSKSITLLAAAPIVVTSQVRPASNCTNDGSIELYRTGGIGPYTYSLDNLNYQLSNVFSNLAAGSVFTGWVKDAQGCTGSLPNITITEVPALTTTAFKTNSSTCVNDGTIQMQASGGVYPYSYSLDNITFQPGNTFANLSPGTYTCWVKDAKGCLASTNVSITSNPIIVTVYTGPSNSCNTNGMIQLFRTGGTGPYTYSLDNISFTNNTTFYNLPGGVYTAWVKDSKGCKGSLAGITVASGVGISVTAEKTNTSACINNGAIVLHATGGTQPLTYSKDNTIYQSSNSFTQLGPGNFVCWVKDANGCKASVNVTININHIIVSATVTDMNNCTVPDGSILVTRTGGTGGFTYSLDGNNYQTSNLFTGLEAGDYMAFVKDSNICIGMLPNITVNTTCVSFTGKGLLESKPVMSDRQNINVRVFPNPSVSFFTLNLDGYSPENVRVRVTDIMGRKVYQCSGRGNQQFRFGNGFSPGIYLVEVKQGDRSESTRIMKE